MRKHGLGHGVSVRPSNLGWRYARGFSDRTYAYLAEQARRIIAGGWSVIIDATFLERARRDGFATLAETLRVPFLILDFQTEQSVLRQRIRARSARDIDASDAGLAVLEHQLANHDPLTAEENVMTVDSTRGADTEAVMRAMRDSI